MHDTPTLLGSDRFGRVNGWRILNETKTEQKDPETKHVRIKQPNTANKQKRDKHQPTWKTEYGGRKQPKLADDSWYLDETNQRPSVISLSRTITDTCRNDRTAAPIAGASPSSRQVMVSDQAEHRTTKTRRPLRPAHRWRRCPP